MNGWRRKRERERESQVNFRCDGDEVRMLDELKAAYGVSKGELLRLLIHREHGWFATGEEIARPPRRSSVPEKGVVRRRRSSPPGPVAYLDASRRAVVEAGRGASCVGEDDDARDDDDPAASGTVEPLSVKGTG